MSQFPRPRGGGDGGRSTQNKAPTNAYGRHAAKLRTLISIYMNDH